MGTTHRLGREAIALVLVLEKVLRDIIGKFAAAIASGAEVVDWRVQV